MKPILVDVIPVIVLYATTFAVTFCLTVAVFSLNDVDVAMVEDPE